MKKTILTLLAMTAMTVCAQYKSNVWSPDNGDGTYTNPVINADYSDPDVCVGPSGEDYYMTASSFQCTPGLPILHSRDLVNWEIVNYAIGNLYEGDSKMLEHFKKPQHGNGVWAPSIRYHAGQYYIYWGDPDFGVMMVKTFLTGVQPMFSAASGREASSFASAPETYMYMYGYSFIVKTSTIPPKP